VEKILLPNGVQGIYVRLCYVKGSKNNQGTFAEHTFYEFIQINSHYCDL